MQTVQEMGKPMNIRQKMVVVIIDILILAQLTYAVYTAQQSPSEVAFVFLKNFIPMVIVTLIAGKMALKRLGPRHVTGSEFPKE